MPDDPDGRRATLTARHPRDRPARGGAWTVGRRRHQRCAHHGERGAAPGRGRSARTLPFARCPRSRSSRPLPDGAWRLAEHGRGSGDPQQDRAALHRADDGGPPQSCGALRERPFTVQTTAGSHNRGELDAIADFAHDRLAAKVWNLYFLVPTGRGQFVSDMTPAQYDDVLAALYRIQGAYQGRMLVNAKCAPHYIKTVLEQIGRASCRERV